MLTRLGVSALDSALVVNRGVVSESRHGFDRGGWGSADGRAASHSAIGAARLHPLPGFDGRSINHLVWMGPYCLEGRGGPSWSVLRA